MKTMHWIERSILVALLAAATTIARADPPQISSCVLQGGHPMYGDNADRCKNGAVIRALDRDGTPKGVMPAAGARQSKEQEERQARREKCLALNKQRYQKDIALLERYPSEDDLQEQRYRDLGGELKRVNEADERLKELIAKGRVLAEKVKFFDPPHRIPDDLRKDRDFNRELEQGEFERIAGAAHEIQHINEKYDADLKRYRELMNGTANKSCYLNND